MISQVRARQTKGRANKRFHLKTILYWNPLLKEKSLENLMKDLLGIVGTAQKVLKSIISEKNAER